MQARLDEMRLEKDWMRERVDGEGAIVPFYCTETWVAYLRYFIYGRLLVGTLFRNLFYCHHKK